MHSFISLHRKCFSFSTSSARLQSQRYNEEIFYGIYSFKSIESVWSLIVLEVGTDETNPLNTLSLRRVQIEESWKVMIKI